jgi:hypothetical protein
MLCMLCYTPTALTSTAEEIPLAQLVTTALRICICVGICAGLVNVRDINLFVGVQGAQSYHLHVPAVTDQRGVGSAGVVCAREVWVEEEAEGGAAAAAASSTSGCGAAASTRGGCAE